MLRILILVLLVGLGVGLHWVWPNNSLATLQALVLESGWWGWLVFMALYVLAVLVLFPASLFTLAGGFLFGPVVGSLLNFISAMIGLSCAFFLVRCVDGGWLRERLNRQSALQKSLPSVGEHDWKLVALLRLIPLVPFTLLNYGLGLGGVSIRAYLLGSLFILPGTIAYTVLGSLGESVLVQGKSWVDAVFIGVGILAALALVQKLIKQRQSKLK